MRSHRLLRGGPVAPVLRLALALLAGFAPATARPGPGPVAAPEICVIAPRTRAESGGGAVARVPLRRPTIFVREPLDQVRLLRGATVLWERQAGLDGPIQGPIAWPLPPLGPGETVRLLLRPVASGSAGAAEILVRAAAAADLQRTDRVIANLRADPAAWLGAVERALAQGDADLATALLFAFEGPSAPDLDSLRLEAFQRSCRQETPP
jgi:hypothetical protein